MNPKHPDNMDPTYFDQFLKTTTPSFSTTEGFSTTESSSESTTTINNDTDFESEFLFLNDTEHEQDEGKSTGFDHEVYDNNLENSTEYRNDVEQLFESNKTRMKRFIGKLYESEKKTQIYVSCHNAGGFTSSRQRWWYIALANCGSKKGIEVYYRFIMTNGPRGDFWHEHFSADEMCKYLSIRRFCGYSLSIFIIDIPVILMAESIAYSFLLLAIFLCAIELKTRCLYHCTYRLFTLSAVFQWLGIILNSTTWVFKVSI